MSSRRNISVFLLDQCVALEVKIQLFYNIASLWFTLGQQVESKTWLLLGENSLLFEKIALVFRLCSQLCDIASQ
jgi:hypothetical protein